MSREKSADSATHPHAGATQELGSAELVPEQPAVGIRTEMLNILAQMNTILERQNEILGGHHKTQNLVEQFLKLNPPNFDGSGKPEEAEKWVFEMENIFDFLQCDDKDRLIMAGYQLEGNAMHWWRATEPSLFPEGKEMVWSTFVTAFFNKFYSNVAQDRKVNEFMELKQGEMTVDEYESKFSELSRFAPRLVKHADDKAKKFLKGLKPEIKKQLLPFGPMSYGDLYSRALYIEQGMMEEEEDKNEQNEHMEQKLHEDVSKGKRPMQFDKRTGEAIKRPYGRSFGLGGGRSSNQSGERSVNQSSGRTGRDQKFMSGLVCRQCGMQHNTYFCPRLQRCFGCGQAGHLARDCPQGRQTQSAPSSQTSKPVTQGRGQSSQNQESQKPPAQETRYKFAPANEGDKQQLQWFCEACEGIPQAIQPAHLPRVHPRVRPSAPPAQGDLKLARATNASIQTQSAGGSSRNGSGKTWCVVCRDAPVEGACVPCGHMAGCMSCLVKIKADSSRCPVCREKIDQVLKLYGV